MALDARQRIPLLRQAAALQPGSPKILFALAEALADGGRPAEAADVFRRAFVASERRDLPAWCALTKSCESADRIDALVRHGAVFSYLIAMLAVAHARSGREEQLKTLVDYDRLLRTQQVTEPSGFDAGGFNAALAGEVSRNLHYHDEPADRAIRHAWRTDLVMSADTPACCAWEQVIRRTVADYVEQLPVRSTHPFAAARPPAFDIEAWAIASGARSYHRSHVHSRAWITGVYYVLRPPVSLDPVNRAGWLHVGPPEHLGVSISDGWDERWIEPEAGSLTLMPGYFFHETRPTGVNENRLCIAFDVVPSEMSARAHGRRSA